MMSGPQFTQPQSNCIIRFGDNAGVLKQADTSHEFCWTGNKKEIAELKILNVVTDMKVILSSDP